jgi:hypothetical protein
MELALIGYLHTYKKATSEEIYEHLKKRGFLAVKGTKQVSMICRSYEKKGVLLSRKPDLGNLQPDVKKKWRLKIWMINPNFYKEHRGQSMFSIHVNTLEEGRMIRRRRMKTR